MKRCVVLLLAGSILVARLADGRHPLPAAQTGAGSIKGHIHLAGRLPGNALIRMGADPKCADVNRGKQVVQEAVLAARDGSLANVFVHLEGKFPPTPLPPAPVTIEQLGCIYSPRVVGMRVGQTLQIRNADALLHNTRSISNYENVFNFAQTRAGIVDTFKMQHEEIMLRLGCDLHRWMTAHVGVVSNPYFAVTGVGGTFEISQVPAGAYTIQAWHEKYGPIRKSVRVAAGAVTAIDFSYTATDK